MNTPSANDTKEGVRKMLVKFEAKGLLSVVPGPGMKPVSVETEETAALAVEGATMGHAAIWVKKIPHVIHPVRLHSPKVTAWCGMTASVIIGPFCFEEQSIAGPVTSTVTAASLESMVRRFVISELHQRGVLDTAIFMHDGDPPHIGTCVSQTVI
ncbi:hypothetical protein AVEN_162736-1 [Araneus ventricosus]|uniref:Uncharacterized protein n=1 Tax=Araneus ventricosus TaxID=182803 RepID=A0A4Y2DCA1_ARAVE|nr:hypothetical protein AVEN_162736-1 [Araneus ventricosus]